MLKEIFSQRLNTQSKTVNNAIITLGDIDDSGKGRKFKSRFLTPGIAGYPGQFGNVLIKKESFDKFVKTLEGAPVIINHKNLTEENADTARVGVVSNVWFNDKDGWYWCDGIIWDKTAQNLITDKGWSVSCSYDVKLADDAGGSENNIPYNIEFLDGVFTHLAIVNNPRYERANIVFNSKTEVINDKWITIHPNGEDSKGRPLLLKDGENVYEAMQRQWGISSPGQQHLFSVSKYKSDKNYKKELDAKIAELNKNIEKSKRDEAYKEAKKINDEWGSSDMPVSEYSAKAKRFEEKFGRPLAEVTRELRSKEASIKPHGQDSDDYRRIKLEDGETPKEAIERTYKKEDSEKGKKEYTWKNQKYSLQDLLDAGFEPIKYTSSIYKDDPLTYLKKEEGKKYYRVPLTESEYQEALKAKENKKTNALMKAKKESKDLIDYVKWQYNEDIEPYITRKEGDKTIVDWYDLPRGAKSALQQIQRGGRLSLDMYSGREMSIEIIDKKILENLQRHRANNNKENTDMALLDELKKLITKVENDKGEDMDDEKKIENEKVDKRDIIRQIMAIAGKHEDNEDVRTIAKLAEKLAYDKSEAGTADNKKVKNAETEEDEEKYEDLKKDVKKDVENKCKNSVDNSKTSYFDDMNKVYNKSIQPKVENSYVSRAQKLKDAEEYFKN